MKRAGRTCGPAVASIERRHAGLVVLDLDEVVLAFVGPYDALLRETGAAIHFESFRLSGNVRFLATGAVVGGGELEALTQRLYDEQHERQPLVPGAAAAIAALDAVADIVFLTAMTPTHYERRRALLDANGLHQPMIATERSKGAVMAELIEGRQGPCVFVDDLPPNLLAVQRSAPTVRLVHLMAHEGFRAHLPPLPAGAVAARDWPHAEAIIRDILGA